SLLMKTFYQKLSEGCRKSAALRHAQQKLVTGELGDEGISGRYTHPYFWAPFYLVGDNDPL
ncbi:MAG: CHAT domain-containing protein, partial [Desulfobulbaceae bacterium]|nr:CHAT domain-containing protein [Desulfobulbaceae bacterium]